jgi:hypothetical protein
MNNQAVVIKDFWANTVDSVGQGLRELKIQLAKLGPLPKDIVIISAGEVKPLLNPMIQQFCLQLEQNSHCRLSYISAACTSFHAAVLDFVQHPDKQRLIITLELDQSLQQGCLNALGIGMDPDQDGLEVIDGVGYCLLSKEQPYPDSLIIEDCEILSQPKGMTGIQKLILRLNHYLCQVPERCQPVSFDICSLWGKKLILGLDARLPQTLTSDCWLPSAEQHNHHYLSLKPTLELQLYKDKLRSGNLLLMTLGGGGRIGCLRISRGVTDIRMMAESSFSEHSLTDDMSCYHAAINNEGNSVDDYYASVKTTLKYPQAQYRGLNNHYFRWTSEQFNHSTKTRITGVNP